ncbi:MAG: hypothetical protein ACPGXK_05775 [Phycisphaerae bacterium]
MISACKHHFSRPMAERPGALFTGIVAMLLSTSSNVAWASGIDSARPHLNQRAVALGVSPVEDWSEDDTTGRPAPQKRPALGAWFRLSIEERQELRAFVKANFPELAKRLKNRKGVPIWFRKHVGPLVELMKATEADPERGQLMIRERRLEMQMHMLTERYRRNPQPKRRQRLERQLNKVCQEWYQVRLELRGMMISKLEERVQTLKQKHQRFKANKKEMIAREVQRQLRRADGDAPAPTADPKNEQSPVQAIPQKQSD